MTWRLQQLCASRDGVSSLRIRQGGMPRLYILSSPLYRIFTKRKSTRTDTSRNCKIIRRKSACAGRSRAEGTVCVPLSPQCTHPPAISSTRAFGEHQSHRPPCGGTSSPPAPSPSSPENSPTTPQIPPPIPPPRKRSPSTPSMQNQSTCGSRRTISSIPSSIPPSSVSAARPWR